MPSFPLRKMAYALVACAALAPMAGSFAQSFPSKAVRIVVGFAPGGGGDVSVRLVTQAIGNSLGQPLVVENRPGAGGTLAGKMVASSAADGHTLMIAEQGASTYAAALFRDPPYDPAKVFVGVSPIFKTPFILVAGPGLAARDLKAFVDQAKANPGKIAYGHSGVGTSHHLSVELFKQRSGLDLQAVAYKGGSLSTQDTVSGQIPISITGLSNVEGLLTSGQLRGIAMTSKSRVPNHPEIPTLSEIVPNFEAYSELGLWAPIATPRDALVKLNAEFARALRSPEIVKAYNERGWEAVSMNLEDFNKKWQTDLSVWPDLIRRLRITLD